MLLVLDIGNSNIVMGAYDGRKLLRHWRISTDRQKTGDEYGILINELFHYQGIRMTDIEAIIISSVVPPLVVPLRKMCERYFHIRPLIVGPGIRTGIRLNYENPRSIGADRIVNVIGAHEQLPRIELVPPKTVVCRSTIQGMQAGIIYGYVGQIDEIVRRIKAETAMEMKVVATGGFARMVAKESKMIDKVDHFLTLTGLRVLYERNQP